MNFISHAPQTFEEKVFRIQDHEFTYEKGMKKACQFFGHHSDSICEEPKLRTVYVKPVCSSNGCPDVDFLYPTHNLYQTFCDENLSWFHVFFENSKQNLAIFDFLAVFGFFWWVFRCFWVVFSFF